MINIKLIDLKNMVNELVEDGVEYLEIFLIEAETIDGDYDPATLHFVSYDGFGGGCEYDPLEGVEVDAFYKLTH